MRNKRGCNPARRWSTTALSRTAASAEFSTMESKTVLITPEIAEDLLTRNKINRPWCKNNLNYLKEELRSGRWQLTHQGIAISACHLILDGQHRLRAIKETGISAELLVTNDVDRDVFKVLDTGKRRNGADILSINGGQQPTTLAAGIRSYLAYKLLPSLKWTGVTAAKITNALILDEYQNTPSHWNSAGVIASKYKTPGLVMPGSFCCFYYMAFELGYDSEFLEKFAENIKEGVALEKNNPILAFRNKCFLYPGKGDGSQQWLANYIKLFNYVCEKKELKIFRPQEIVPMPSMIEP